MLTEDYGVFTVQGADLTQRKGCRRLMYDDDDDFDDDDV